MVTLSFVNNKGGVGKTTLAANLAQALAIVGQKVLCIDNDGQHNLTTMLGLDPSNFEATIRDIYTLRDPGTVDTLLPRAIRESSVTNLHCITAPDSLSDADIADEHVLTKILPASFIPGFYDFLVIDNHPGISTLQRVSLHPANFVLIPTELQQLPVNGLSVMYRFLTEVFHFTPENIRILPNKYRDVNRQKAFLETINHLFPGCVVDTPIPLDTTFDELVTESKIMFLDRLRSAKAVPYLVKLMVELFPFAEDSLFSSIKDTRDKHLADNNRIRLQQRKEAVTA